ncbi:sensor histidine kinase [Rudanella lutea]|uniref:sensor histidine kinase n=1 Tax=Rudanella lutea TaxID=451374 RepID=UPI00036C5DBE|nr:HAMP domain-containing sensor histidine kinase [Rudanella lutea]
MTIRNRLTLRFTGLVSSILLLVFVSIYAFCWFFISADFYRRLDRKASTTGDMLIRHRLDADLIRQLGRLRKDQLPSQKIMVFDARDSLIFTTNEALTVPIPATTLAKIRVGEQTDFRQGIYYLSGSRYTTDSGGYVVIASAQNTDGDDFLSRLLLALLCLFILIVGVTTLAGWVFAGDALRPMQRLDQTLSHIFPHNREERLPVGPESDEISRLSMTINSLLDRVGESFRVQRMFVANVSHELRNPLTQISSQLEVSLLNRRDPDAYQKTIRSVLEDVTELTALTRELLQLSQVSGDGTVGLLTGRIRIDEIVWDVRDQVNALQPGYRVQVEWGDLPDDPDLLTIQGNKTLLRTALKNLTENACKFSDDRRALLRVRVQPEQVQIDVQNTGTPIPASDLPYIFEPFYRSRQTADVRGYGVGLSLVERIARVHGGQVTVSSEAGRPTIFTVALPRPDAGLNHHQAAEQS